MVEAASAAAGPEAAVAAGVDAAAAELDALTLRALALAEAALAAGRTRDVPDVAVQRLLAAGLRLLARKIDEEQRHFLPVPDREAVTPTDVAMGVTELLRTVNLNLFDLSMWASRPRFAEDSNTGQL